MKGKKPNKAESAHLDRVAALGCIVCRQLGFHDVPAEIHHTEGKTKEGAHFRVLPLCYDHHRSQINDPGLVSVHPWKAEFQRRYGSYRDLLDAVDNALRSEE